MHEIARRSISRTFLTDWCRITRAVPGPGVLNRETLEVVFDRPETVYSGRCSVSDSAGSRSSDGLGAEIAVDEQLLKVPASVHGLRVGDVVEITSADDPDLVDRTLEIVRIPRQSQTISRSVVCRDESQFPTRGGEASS